MSGTEREKFARICPDFVVELRSKTDRFERLKDKMEEYLQNGCRLGFLIDPVKREAYVYETEKEPLILTGFSQKLSGGKVLPGFEPELRLFL